MLEILTVADFEAFYKILADSFPPTERRTKAGQKALFYEPKYKVFGSFGDKLEGFIAIWEFSDFAFIEHFAVEPKCRNKGLGGQMLKELSSLVNKPLILEVEPPESDITRRRIVFYERHGFNLNLYDYTQPSMAIGQPSIPLKIMSFPTSLERDGFLKVKQTLYKEVYKVIFDL